MVNKRTLLLVAGIVWCLAGFNVARIGVVLYGEYLQVLNVVMSLVVFILFGMMFSKMTKKHTKRIGNYQGKQPLYKFFNVQSYCIMVFMMSFGIWLRHSGLCPMRFIAVFYTGLGSALFLAGVLFIINWVKFQEQPLEFEQV
jgi:hypothetical protein